jgi:hypothetical protein
MKVRKKTLGVFVLLFSFLAPLRLPAAVYETHERGTIRIDSCRIVRSGKTDVVPPFGGLSITYANLREKPATRVDFIVTYDGVTQTVYDIGRFTHNAQIRHRFNAFSRYPLVISAPNCIASSVRFANADQSATVQNSRKKKKRHFWLFFWWW